MASEGFFERVIRGGRADPRGDGRHVWSGSAACRVVRGARGTWLRAAQQSAPGEIPCHRVVFADGRICAGFAFGGPDAQRELLMGEGVTFADPMHVDLAACRWPAGL